MVTLPLKRIHQARDDIHPQVVSPRTTVINCYQSKYDRQLLQQHINRGLRRVARMTRREEPSKRQLEANIHKRMYIPASGPGARNPASKRYNRHGADLAANAKGKKVSGKAGKAAKGAA